MNTVPKVSIVIPCYNRAEYLGMAIQSVLAQTYTDFELIIVDNNSTDGSLEIAQIAAQNDSRVHVVTEEIQGVVYALRKGFGEAKGVYVCSVDSDDLLQSTALENTVAVLDANPDCGMVYTNYQDINETGKIISVGWRCSHQYTPEKLLTTFMTFHFRLIRRTVYEQIGGFDPAFELIEDYDLCLRLSEVTQIKKIEIFLYLKRNHPDSIMNTHRLEQIELTKQVIEAAMKRRNLDKTHVLNITFNPRYSLRLIESKEI